MNLYLLYIDFQKKLVVSPILKLVKFKYRNPQLKAAHLIEFLKKILLKTIIIDRLGKRLRFLNLYLSVEEKYWDPLKREKKYFMGCIYWDTPDKILRKEVKFQENIK